MITRSVGPFGRNLVVINEASPALGAEWVYSPPNGVRLNIYAIRVELATDATVANRQTVLVFKDGYGGATQRLVLALPAGSTDLQPASTNWNYYYSGFGNSRAQLDSRVLVAMPYPFPVFGQGVQGAAGAMSIETVSTNLQAGDRYRSPTIYAAYLGAND